MCSPRLLENMELFLWSHTWESTRKVTLQISRGWTLFDKECPTNVTMATLEESMMLPSQAVSIVVNKQVKTKIFAKRINMCDASGKEPACQCRRHKRHGFSPWVRKIPWKRVWQPTPVFLPGESHGQRSLVNYHPQGPQRDRQDCSDLAHIEHVRHPKSQDSFLKCVKENEGRKQRKTKRKVLGFN